MKLLIKKNKTNSIENGVENGMEITRKNYLNLLKRQNLIINLTFLNAVSKFFINLIRRFHFKI